MLITKNPVQADRWIRFEADRRSFVTTDYVTNELNVPINAVPVSSDLDTTITDVGTLDETP